ncbi:hypothetical protein ASPZODRAFT_27215 [Penicilliopsis zonata CBS 506.65]|uniref:Ribophorin II C-terminal domain-containing protein n=1 Tax=Penicilliopsis zonata CBS 506.65 TaxID=1073090 RepID=A0A1L9SBQ5_9EURO|nr:hypothetical protein ASPZODRAFT_27215 [Penicilliopsis zonata CBS 506.65]OJJ44558.1 hypothetical protein ASPZODRAFT_27215 [Penicilliopsis zonata CBS 506.65]
MHLSSALQLCLLASALPAHAATSWGFSDATVSVQTKGAGVGAGLKEQIDSSKPLANPVSLGDADTLKLTLTAEEGNTAKRPHQAFLLLKDGSGLDISFPLSVKDNGKARLELTQKDLPLQFLAASEPIDANLVIGSFGSAGAYNGPAFQLAVERNADEPLPSSTAERYGQLPEIHHIFRSDARSPPVVITLAFVAMALASLPVLAGLWLFLGANLNHLPAAFKTAPIPHAVFVGALVALEGIFFLYYTSWNLFQMLPPALAVGAVAFVSGSRALSEVQGRRLAGLR